MDDLILEFITETNESLAALDNEIVRLEQNPNDTNLLNNIFRLMHTIKGTCGFLGLSKLEKVAHAGENVLDKLRHKELDVTQTAISLILESIDRIKGLLEHLEQHGAESEVDNSPLIAKLNEFAETGALAENAEATVTAKPTKAAKKTKGKKETAPVVAAQEPDEHGFIPVPAGATADLAETVAATNATKTKEVAVSEGLKAGQQAEKSTTANAGATSSNQSIRVNIDVLENLMQLVSELVLTRNQLLQVLRSQQEAQNEYTAPLQRLSHITSDLQEGIMQTRMQPIGNAWQKLPRIIRDLSIELNKKIDLRMNGEDTELDRQLLELIRDPLTHMVRNSADHGIEMPADRVAAGKPETGTVTLSAFHEAGHIIVEIKDDGKGLDVERIKNKAITNGIISKEQADALDKRQIFQFIFAAGFSTAEQVTAVSGRGVGMDVVRTNIEKMGGSIELDSEQGKGSVFRIKIPLTLAIMPVLIFDVNNEKYAIPQINVVELVRVVDGSENKIEMVNQSPVLRLRGRLLPLIDLKKVMEIGGERKLSEKHFIVVCEMGNFSFGIIVDKIHDSEEIVVKPSSTPLKKLNLYSGCTILGDGSVIMILDPNGLIKTITKHTTTQKEEVVTKLKEEDIPVSFLVFRAGSGAPKAVPLELISRLEEVDPKRIENAGDLNVVQYRGDLMRIATLNNKYEVVKPAENGEYRVQPVIVFVDAGKVLGLAVEEIIDIVEQPMKVSLNDSDSGYLGSMVINGKTTDIIDVGHYFQTTFSDWRKKPVEEKYNKTRKILLVEDSPFFRKLMVPVLMSHGYEVKTAGDGVQGLKILDENSKYDLIVTDIDMPNMNGLDFAEKCKANPITTNIPIIALTSNSAAETIKRAESIGLHAFIAKADREKLFEVIVELLERIDIGVNA